jgi:hypothetical protein
VLQLGMCFGFELWREIEVQELESSDSSSLYRD